LVEFAQVPDAIYLIDPSIRPPTRREIRDGMLVAGVIFLPSAAFLLWLQLQLAASCPNLLDGLIMQAERYERLLKDAKQRFRKRVNADKALGNSEGLGGGKKLSGQLDWMYLRDKYREKKPIGRAEDELLYSCRMAERDASAIGAHDGRCRTDASNEAPMCWMYPTKGGTLALLFGCIQVPQLVVKVVSDNIAILASNPKFTRRLSTEYSSEKDIEMWCLVHQENVVFAFERFNTFRATFTRFLAFAVYHDSQDDEGHALKFHWPDYDKMKKADSQTRMLVDLIWTQLVDRDSPLGILPTANMFIFYARDQEENTLYLSRQYPRDDCVLHAVFSWIALGIWLIDWSHFRVPDPDTSNWLEAVRLDQEAPMPGVDSRRETQHDVPTVKDRIAFFKGVQLLNF
ncbi:hypothetical protein OBBRIDRAFT_808680, partial [Obba rivulosa]